MKIDSERRYFKLKPEAAARFEECKAARTEAIKAKIEAAEQILEDLGVPSGAVKIELFTRNFDVAFPEKVREHIPNLFTKPNTFGFVRLKKNRKEGKRLQAKLDGYKVPSRGKWFPTLKLGQRWFVGNHMLSPVLGSYGEEVVLIGIPKDPGWCGEPYEPDLDLLEEMTLAEWAALVERVEAEGVVA